MTINRTPAPDLDQDDLRTAGTPPRRTPAPRRVRGLVGATATLGLVLGLAACGQSGGPRAQAAEPTSADTSATTPGDGNQLVLRVTLGDGGTDHMPLLSLYRDGRIITEGPGAAVDPTSALPNLQVVRLDQQTVDRLVDAARDAGVTKTDDLGTPSGTEDLITTITLVTDEGTSTRQVHGLREGDATLTPEQTQARTDLADLVDELTEASANSSQDKDIEDYVPTDLAVLATPYPTDPQVTSTERTWPGATLPGDTLTPDLGCTVATGDQARALLDAAHDADTRTRWTDGGATWSVTFRPLLPDETSCADLAA